MNMKNLKLGFLLLLLVGSAFGGEEGTLQGQSDVPLTGNLRVDLFGSTLGAAGPLMQQTTGEQEPIGKKSPWLAAGMSLVVPGSGEFYAESYWKAAAFFVVDVVAWTVAISNDKKGDDQTASFQGYANEKWSVAKYANWTLDNASYITDGAVANPRDDYQVFDTNGNVNWSELNRLERAIGEWYSHTLPPYGEQQYYELIGKYEQFYQGWDDANPALRDYAPIKNELDSKGTATHFGYYSVERGKANDYYATASTAVTIAIVNHVLSAIDAAWSAGSFNRDLKLRVGMQSIPRGSGYAHLPALQLSYRL
jgi:hypothetical protein